MDEETRTEMKNYARDSGITGEFKATTWDSDICLVAENVALGVAVTQFSVDDFEPIMQYVGLKDKNVKEIYEGDVVLFDYEKILVSYGIQGVDAFEGIGFNLWSHYGQKQDGTRLQSEIEVVGNIYESPELLNTSI